MSHWWGGNPHSAEGPGHFPEDVEEETVKEETRDENGSFVAVTLHLTIHDAKDFRQAAYERALEDGLDEDDAKTFLDPEGKHLGECAVMLFDPGMSPQGCSIVDSSTEYGKENEW